MNCVKCGRDIPEDQVFCEKCLAEMEMYPVNPGTAVHIPTRSPEEEIIRKPVKKKHIPTAEELLLRTRKKLRRNRIFVVVLLLACGLLSVVLGQTALELDIQRLVGQNYKITGLRPSGSKGMNFTILPTEEIEPATEEAVAYIEEKAERMEESDETPAETPAADSTEPATQPPTEMPNEATTEAPTEAPTEIPTEAPTETPVTEAPSKESAETPAEAPTTEVPTESVAAAADTPMEETTEESTV